MEIIVDPIFFTWIGEDGEPINCCSNGNNPFDLTFDPNSAAVCLPIEIPRNDPFYRGGRTCMNLARSQGAPDIGKSNY